MTIHQVAIDLTFTAPEVAPEQTFEELLDRVLDQLENIGREADYTASLTALTASFTLVTGGRNLNELVNAATDLRVALHAAGCGTPGWPYEIETIDQSREGLIEA